MWTVLQKDIDLEDPTHFLGSRPCFQREAKVDREASLIQIGENPHKKVLLMRRIGTWEAMPKSVLNDIENFLAKVRQH